MVSIWCTLNTGEGEIIGENSISGVTGTHEVDFDVEQGLYSIWIEKTPALASLKCEEYDKIWKRY